MRRELEAEFQLTLKQYERGELAEAARQFEKLAIDDPTWVAPRQLLAEVYYRIGDLDRAASQLEWLTLHAVEHPRLALISGAIALASRNMPEALDALRYAAHVEPELPSVHTLLGTVYFRLGNLEAAKTEYQHALKQRTTTHMPSTAWPPSTFANPTSQTQPTPRSLPSSKTCSSSAPTTT